MRIWDRVHEELVVRQPSGLVGTSCRDWHGVEDARLGLTLRLGHEERGARLFSSPAEQAQGRRIEAEGRRVAEERVRELEAELRRRTP